jgi:hypothetical protein
VKIMETRKKLIYNCTITLLVVVILFLSSIYISTYKLNIQYEKTTNSCGEAYCALLDYSIFTHSGKMTPQEAILDLEQLREAMLICDQKEEGIKCGDKCELNNVDCSGDTCKPIDESLPMFNCDSQTLTTEKCEEMGVIIKQ